MNLNISLCPTILEFDNGDRYDAGVLLDAMRAFIIDAHPDARIACLQIGHRQGDNWATVGGDEEAGADLCHTFFMFHGSNECLFSSR